MAYLTAQDVAARWKCHRTTVTALARARKLRGMRLGSDWRFSVADVEAYELAQTSEPQPAPVVETRTVRRAVGEAAYSLPADFEPVFPGVVPWRSSVIEDRPAAGRGQRTKRKAASVRS